MPAPFPSDTPGNTSNSAPEYAPKEREPYAASATLEQWQRFHDGLSVDSAVINETLLQSWQRSRDYGVNPRSRPEKRIPHQELTRILAENMEFIDSSKTIMAKLFKSVEAANSVISLADSNGAILHTYSHHSGEHLRASHGIGSIASEKVCGTNGIGTCIHCCAPVELVGAQHYCEHEHVWACSAAPIFDSKSRLLGVFNISISRQNLHHHTQGMVEAAAHAISEQVCLRELIAEQTAIMELLDEGVLVVSQGGLLKSINKKACSILGIPMPHPGEDISHILPARDILNTALVRQVGFHDQEVFLDMGHGTISCLISAAPMAQQGVVFTLREGTRMRELATRAIGAKAIYTFDRILGDSPCIRDAVQQGEIAARSDITTLIIGKSGTGKELFAQSIHNAGRRRKQPFVVVNCGALPRNLVQSELFGYDEGAFTGASRMGKPGKFELADGGTIFLDEIGEMPLEAQVSLLRLLQNREVTRVGGKRSRQVDVRVIAATNKNLEEAVSQNVFRNDLYYRLNAFLISVPSLAERADDIFALCRHFLCKFAQALGKPLLEMDSTASEFIRRYAWPGNVRELENVMERAVNVCAGGVITIEDLPPHLVRHTPPAASPKVGRLRQQEEHAIRQAIADTNGNLRQAAQLLGISRSTLYLKMKACEITRDNVG